MASFNKSLAAVAAALALCLAVATGQYANGSGSGPTTRYWDCCKPSCAWRENVANVNAPVRTCAANGNDTVDASVQSGCNGGTAYACNNMQPFVASDGKAYAFAAANVNNVAMNQMCCACYALTFTSTAIAGKVLTVQVVNTGNDLGNNHFDLQFPGGGVGAFPGGCPNQWGSWNGGAQYGGLTSADQCSQLPSALQPGCQFRFGWFQNADNPTINFNRVACPAELTNISGCKRSDD